MLVVDLSIENLDAIVEGRNAVLQKGKELPRNGGCELGLGGSLYGPVTDLCREREVGLRAHKRFSGTDTIGFVFTIGPKVETWFGFML